VQQYEEEIRMPYITSVERFGIQKGRQEGRQEGELLLVLRQLNRRLGAVDPALQVQIQQLSVEQLEDLAEALLDFSQPEDLAAWLEAHHA
jgi:predicted transposase YdaD